jgi:hypothetical protein
MTRCFAIQAIVAGILAVVMVLLLSPKWRGGRKEIEMTLDKRTCTMCGRRLVNEQRWFGGRGNVDFLTCPLYWQEHDLPHTAREYREPEDRLTDETHECKEAQNV